MQDWSIVVRKYMVKDLRLRGDELLAFAVIAQCCNEDNVCEMTDDEFGRVLNCNEAEAYATLESLCEKEYIIMQKADGLRTIIPDYDNVFNIRHLGEVDL